MSAEMEKLLDAWQNSYGNRSATFVRDGVIASEFGAWMHAVPKILFVLKESHDRNGVLAECDYDLRRLFREPELFTGHRRTVERTLGRWAHTISGACRGEGANWDLTARECTTALQFTAVMNLKKLAGGSTSSAAEIERHARRDCDFIERQLELLAPDLVICGGTFEIAEQILGGFKPIASTDCYMRGRTAWVRHFHPACRETRELRDKGLLERCMPVLPRSTKPCPHRVHIS